MTEKGETGARSEEAAVKYLENIGYKIIKRNFRFGKISEIDIIADDKDTLVFIEVRSGSTVRFGNLLESVTPAKQKKIRRAAEAYLYINKVIDKSCRFDVIAIDNSGDKINKPDIFHLANAF